MKKRFEILATAERKLKSKIRALAKKAATTGCEFKCEIIDRVVKPYSQPIYDMYGQVASYKTVMATYLVVTLEGSENVGFTGWEVGAVISHVTTDDSLIYRRDRFLGNDDNGQAIEEAIILDSELKDSYKPTCDHCNKSRKRGTTLLIKHVDTDEIKQVGKACLDTFCETDSAWYIENTFGADLAELANKEEEKLRAGNIDFISGLFAPTTKDFLAHVAQSIRKEGTYISKGQAYSENITSTVDRAYKSYEYVAHNQLLEENTPTQDDINNAAIALAWIATIDPAGNDYLTNLKTSCSIDHVTKKTAGFVASVYKALENSLVKAAKEAAAPAAIIREGRYAITATVLSFAEREYEGRITLKMLVMTDDNQKIWGSVPSSLVDDIVKGDTIEFTAKVARSNKDDKFGFFSRPTKSKIIQK